MLPAQPSSASSYVPFSARLAATDGRGMIHGISMLLDLLNLIAVCVYLCIVAH